MQPGRRHPFHRERLRYDPVFAAELEYCYEKGLPHSYLLGGPLEWQEDDRAKLQALMMERSTKCTMCGTHSWEWEEDRYAYEPMVEVCHGCMLKDMMREEATQPGSTITLVPKAKAAKMRATPKQAPRRAARD